MKLPVPPRLVAFLILGMIAPLSAQNHSSNPTSIDPQHPHHELASRAAKPFTNYRKNLVSAHGQPYQISENSLQTGLALISAIYQESEKPRPSSTCSSLARSIRQQLERHPSQVLEIVEREISTHPACCREILKTVITNRKISVQQALAIVETAMHAAPESTQLIAQCAITTMPETAGGVRALLARQPSAHAAR